MTEQAYFNRFPSFVPNPQATLIANFRALAKSRRWSGNRYKEERKNYMIALADTHIGSIDTGSAADKLAGLQGLCGEVGISRIPTTITKCKKELNKVHVCIIDLIDSRRGLGTAVSTFTSHRTLEEHIKSEKHFFPIDAADDGLLKVLLRTIDR